MYPFQSAGLQPRAPFPNPEKNRHISVWQIFPVFQKWTALLLSWSKYMYIASDVLSRFYQRHGQIFSGHKILETKLLAPDFLS